MKVLVVISGEQGEGKTTMARKLMRRILTLGFSKLNFLERVVVYTTNNESVMNKAEHEAAADSALDASMEATIL